MRGAWVSFLAGVFIVLVVSAEAEQFMYELRFPDSPPVGAKSDNFGRVLAVGDGFLAVASDASGWRRVHLYEAKTGAYLRAVDPPEPSAARYFGQSVALGSGVLAVGCPGYDSASSQPGAVYLFDLKTGAFLRKLQANVPGVCCIVPESFGRDVAIFQDRVLVSAGSGATDDWQVFQLGSGGHLFDLAQRGGLPQAAGVMGKLFVLSDPYYRSPSGVFWVHDPKDGRIRREIYPVKPGAKLGLEFACNLNSIFAAEHSADNYQLAALQKTDGLSGRVMWRSDAYQTGLSGYGAVWAMAATSGRLYVGVGGGSPWALATVWVFDAATGSRLPNLVPPNAGEWDDFGLRMATDGGFVAIAGDRRGVPGYVAGAVCVYSE